MIALSLTDDEARVLRETLTNQHHALIGEIAHTDSLEYKDMLRARETLLSNVLRRLEAESGVGVD